MADASVSVVVAGAGVMVLPGVGVMVLPPVRLQRESPRMVAAVKLRARVGAVVRSSR